MDLRDLFPRGVRERAAGRVFDRPVAGADDPQQIVGYVCAEGLCIVGALLHEAAIPDAPRRPGPSATWLALYRRYPDYDDPRFMLLSDLTWRNDRGEYADRAAVRRALLPEEAS